MARGLLLRVRWQQRFRRSRTVGQLRFIRNGVIGRLIDRGLYLNNFQGQSLRSIKLRHAGVASRRNYKITLTARLGDFAGSVIGEPYTASVNLGHYRRHRRVTYELGDIPVPAAVDPFAMTAGAWDRVLRHPDDAMQQQRQLEDASAPLGGARRDHIDYEVRGRSDADFLRLSIWDRRGDHTSRVVYITNFPGELALRK